MIRLLHHHLRCVLLVATTLFAAAALLALPVTLARADTGAPVASADLDCTITVTTDVHPGVTPQLQHVAVTSHGLTGTADCTGTIDGETVTGPGTFAINIQETANCTQLSGRGQFVLRIPTTGGTTTVAGTFDVNGTSAGAVLTGDLTGTAQVRAMLEICGSAGEGRTFPVICSDSQARPTLARRSGRHAHAHRSPRAHRG